jgi:LuxR family maltose regulon positive regulatory protein
MLKTKLHRPPLSAEHVLRHRLIDELNSNIYKPLTLICAPAGYGKSMLTSSWIEESNNQSVWLSLSEDDNDLRTFVIYIIAAIQKTFPGHLAKTEDLINAPELPSVSLIAQNLINELDQIQEDFIVILDDYHLIHDNNIHQLIDEVLKYPPEHLHLCLLTRRDPALRIRNLRVHNRMTEIRMEELTFTIEEIIELFRNIHGINLKETTAVSLQETTEGWITALRLASMASKNDPEIEESLASFKGELHTLSDFLIEEILSKLSVQLQDLLFITALLGRFCLDLTKSCFLKSENHPSEKTKLDELFNQLINSDLFLIPLDDERKWFRYHHLFQNILINQLGSRFDSRKRASIYLAAANWFEKQGLIDEALHNFILAEEYNKAAALVLANAHSEFVNGVGKVETWLNILPPEMKDNNPYLLLLNAWHAFGQFHLERIPPIIQKVNELIKDTEPAFQISTELGFFQGNFQYWMGDTEGSIKTLSKAMSHFDQVPPHVRCNIQLVLAMAMQKNGAYDKIVPETKSKINNPEKYTGIDIGYFYGILSFVHLLSGNLRKVLDAAEQMQLHTKKIKHKFLLYWSYYLQALAELQLFQTDKALKHFEIVSQKHLIVDTRAVFDSMAATALLEQFNNNSVEAIRLLTNAVNYATEISDQQSLTVIRSAQARIALMQGDLQKATEWANSFDEPPSFAGMFFWQEVPCITKSKVLINTGTRDSLQLAEEVLNLLYDLAAPNHLYIQLVEINLLQSLVLFKTNQVEKSIEKMKAALLQAEKQGFLRPFVEVGDLALEPLEIMKERNVCVDFIQEVTSLIIKRASSVSNDLHKHAFIPSNSNDNEKVVLTNRELETLYLLAEGFRNKEIANKIYVSEGTVKKHVYNMGQKFNTSTRVELINKARDLGYIQTD